ncbi:competence protein ComEA [Isoptericola jiangsuensis]|uniref:Competence protein ComEA n=1 Tax=Isoptericola jiangsuensis TaxID=548579 RepID=A0A2A9EYK9_9MICO|nr:ComEA family DNA-binding protein [Isoptericola jiangsuensis]PFG43656.1 competence protein ComEA [Isoptericola jiangsuensis]
MTTIPPRPADPVAARVDALRAALAGDPAPPVAAPTVGPPWPDDAPAAGPPPPTPPAARGTSATVEGPRSGAPWDPPGGTPDADELADRLRRRRSAAHVAAAYSAAHGHPLDAHAAVGRRWALDARTAVAAACALLLVAVVVLGLALWPSGGDDLVDLAGHQGGVAGVPDPAAPTSDDALGGAVSSAPASSAPSAAGAVTATGAAADPTGSAVTGSATEPGVVVHVVGQVASPGLVTLPAGSRVADALEAAGGATRKADLAQLNLARTVVDGEQVHVPAPGETPPVATVPGAGTSATGAATADAAPGAPVPLNTADVTTLDTLPGVGPVLAERIVAWRDTHGPFTSVDELTEVSGIGPSVLEGLRDLVVV